MRLKFVWCLGLLVWCAVACCAQGLRLQAQKGHSFDVSAIDISQNGRYVLTGGIDGTCLWDAETGKQLLSFDHSVQSVALSPTTQYVLTASGDGFAHLWDIKSGKEIRSFPSGATATASDFDTVPVIAAYSPDGKKILMHSFVTHKDGDISLGLQLCEVGTGRRLFHVEVQDNNSFEALAFSPDGQYFIESRDGKTTLFNTVTGKRVYTFRGAAYGTKGSMFSNDGKYLLTIQDNNGSVHHYSVVHIWDVAAQKEARRFTIGTRNFHSASFSPNGKHILTASFAGGVELWDAGSGRRLRDFSDPNAKESEEQAVAMFSANGQKVLSGGGDEIARLWNTDGSSKEPLRLERQSVDMNRVQIAGDYLLASQLWNIRTGKQETHFAQDDEAITFLSSDAKFIVTASAKGLIQVKNVASNKTLCSFAFGRDIRQGFESDAFLSPNNRYLVAYDGGAGGEVYDGPKMVIWNIANGQQLKIDSPWIQVGVPIFTSDGRGMFACTHIGFEKWDLEKKTLHYRRKYEEGQPGNITLSPDNRYLLQEYYQEGAVLYDASSGKKLCDVSKYWITTASFSKNGHYLFTGSYEGVAELWKLEPKGAKLVRTLQRKGQMISDATFSADARYLVTTSADGLTQVWDVTTGKVLRSLKSGGQIASIDLSPNEHLITSGGDAVEIWDLATGIKKCSIIGFINGDGAVVDTMGRYDAFNAGNVAGLHWVFNLQPIDLAQFKDGFYEPGLLAKVLGYNKEPLRAVPNLADLKLYPEVTPKIEGDKLVVSLKNQGGGIGAVQVLINGKELEADARGGSVSPTAQTANLEVLLDGPMIVPGQENEIEVIARNADGSLASRGTKVIYAPKGKRETKPVHLYAIVAGVSKYADPEKISTLRYAAKDARDMSKAIALAGRGLFEDRVHIQLLTGEASTPPEDAEPSLPVTKENLRKAFEEVAKNATPDDILLVYFSGHGVTLGQGTSTYCYLTQDARSTELASSPFLKDWAVTSEELAEWTKKIGALKQVLVLDTCAAGAASEKLVERKDLSGDAIRAIERMKDRVGFHVLMGSAGDAVSYEAGRYGQGLLTYALLEGMRGRALREEQFVDVTKWFSFAEDRVPELAGSIGGIQRPQIASPKGSSFDVGKLSTPTERQAVPLSVERPQILRPRLSDEDSPDLFDTLGLEGMLRAKLREMSLPSARGVSTPVFVDALELPGAISVGGRYRVEGEIVTVRLGLRRDGKTLGEPIEVEGDKNDLAGLTGKMAEAINGTINGLARS